MAKVSYEVYCNLRDEKGYTNNFVSKSAGIPAACMSDWKHGKATPKPDKLYALAQVFGVPMETFMVEE